MKTLSIISTPFQLFCLKEYCFSKKIQELYIIALVDNQNQKERIDNLSSLLKIDINKLIIAKPFIQYFSLLLQSLKIKTCDELIMGNFFYDPFLFFMNNMKYNKLTIIDDGIISNFIGDYHQTNNRIKEIGFVKTIFINLFNVNINYPDNFLLYTIFDIDDSNLKFIVEKNNLNNFQSLIKEFKKINETFIIGQPFVELNILTQKVYLSCLKSIKTKFDNITYIAGRKENDIKLNAIKNELDIDYIKPNINIEHLMILNNELPKNIVGFTSSALYTIDKIYNNRKRKINVYSYKISNKVINNLKNNYPFKKHYDQIKINEIDIIEM